MVTAGWIDRNGRHGSGSPSEESVFAVSPDDRRIAVETFSLHRPGDLNPNTSSLSVSSIDGTDRKIITQSMVAATMAAEWPVGWRGARIVLQRGLLQHQYAGGYGSMEGFQLLDAETGTPQATICAGDQSQLQVWSPPVAAGVLCADPFHLEVQTWDDGTKYTASGCQPFSPSLSPAGSLWAGIPPSTSGPGCANTTDPIALYGPNASRRSTGVVGSPWGWINSQFLVVNQQSVAAVVSTPFRLVDITDDSVVLTHVTGRFVGGLPDGVIS